MKMRNSVFTAMNAPEIGEYDNPIDFLRAVMNCRAVDLEQRMSAAKILAQATAPRSRTVEYKSKDTGLLEKVAAGNIFMQAQMPAPQRKN